jgi:hypothetical protein
MNFYLLGIPFLLFICQNQAIQQSQIDATVSILDSVPVGYPLVSRPAQEVYTLESLSYEMLRLNSVRFDSLCLVEKETPEDIRKTWCAKCDGEVAIWFREEVEYEMGSNILQINKDSIELKNLLFQPTPGFLDTTGKYSYQFSCEDVRQFRLGQDSFLTFSAGFFFCNGSSCGQHFEFLYHFNTKQLYAFDIYRGRGFFGDANADKVIDYMEIRPKDSWQTLDTISARFYTLNRQKRLFEPLKNEKGEDAIIWLAALSGDDYRFADKLKIISP